MGLLLPQKIKNLLLGGQLKAAVGALLLLVYWFFLTVAAWAIPWLLFALLLKTGTWSTLVVHFANSYDFVPDLDYFDYYSIFIGMRFLDLYRCLAGALVGLDKVISNGDLNELQYLLIVYREVLSCLGNLSYYLVSYPINFQNFSVIEELTPIGQLIYRSIVSIWYEVFWIGIFLADAGFHHAPFSAFLLVAGGSPEFAEIRRLLENLISVVFFIYLPRVATEVQEVGSDEDREVLFWFLNRHGAYIKNAGARALCGQL